MSDWKQQLVAQAHGRPFEVAPLTVRRRRPVLSPEDRLSIGADSRVEPLKVGVPRCVRRSVKRFKGPTGCQVIARAVRKLPKLQRMIRVRGKVVPIAKGFKTFDHDAVIAHREAGLTLDQIERRTGVSRYMQKKFYAAYAPDLLNRSAPLYAKIADTYSSGRLSLREVAEQCGTTVPIAYHAITKVAPHLKEVRRQMRSQMSREKRRPPPKPPQDHPINVAVAIRTIRAGASKKDVAEHYKVHPAKITRMLKAHAPELLQGKSRKEKT